MAPDERGKARQGRARAQELSEEERELFRQSVEQSPPPIASSKAKAKAEAKAKAKAKEAEKLDHRPFAAALKGLAAQHRAAPAPPKPKVTPPAPMPPPVDEARLFAREMSGVRPLEEAPRVPAERERSDRIVVYDDEAEVLAELADLVAGRGDFDSSFSDEHIEGLAEGLDRKLLRKLRRGAFSVGAHLDLHGLTRAEAKPRVEGFLGESRQRGNRCVLLVHGRGLHSKEGIPVLKEAVSSWLLRGRIARIVLAFCSARPCDGGLGALYVLLRR